MRKNTVKIFISALCSALVLSTAAGFFALEKTTANAETANAASQTDALVLPENYENYLDLTAPSDVAVSAYYTAIADGNVIYLYDRKNDVYEKYVHETGSGETQDIIKKLQFSENGYLYYADNSTGANFYELDVRSYEKRKIDAIACSTFIIHGEDLYFANSTGTLYSAVLEEGAMQISALPLSEHPKKPTLAFWNDELYFTDNGTMQTLYRLNPKTESLIPVASFDERIEHMTVGGNVFACTTSKGNFYTYSLPRVEESSLLQCAEGSYTSLAAFGEYVYAVNGKTVRQYSIQDNAFTDYEICSQSNAFNRLNGAADVVLAGDKLYVADNGNQRISVYNTADGSFGTPVVSTLSPSFLSGDEQTLFAANAETAVLYDLSEENYGAAIALLDGLEGEIKGVASVYGKHYAVTEGFVYTLSQDLESGEWQTLTTQRNSFYPELFAADAYGNLYVLQKNGVYAFTESELTDAEKAGRLVCPPSLAHAEKLAVDYHRNVYALANGKIYKNGDTQNAVDFNVPLVYADGVSVTAFTFGVEENQTYLLCDGNYLIRSERLELPTVKTIPVNGADEIIFSAASAEFSVVETEENALLVEFELSELGGAETFPYLAYERSQDKKTALKIGEAGEYYLLAVFDQTRYRTYLSRSEFCSPLAVDDYRTEYAESKVGYLTNEVTLYKFPYLTHLLTVQKLQRGEQVRVLGEITRLDHDYYQVEVVDGEGNATGVTGYVPKAYVSETDGLPPTSENVIFGATDDNGDAIWRLAYLLLGFAAICILVDFLILRKKQD